MAEKPKQTEVEIVQVATATAPAYVTPDGKQMVFEEYIAWLGTTLWEIKKAVA